MAEVRSVASDNPAFVVLEVTVPGSDLPAQRVSIAAAAIADGSVDLDAEIDRLTAQADERLANWRAAQAVLARIGGAS